MKTYMPLNGLRWSRNSGSANCDMPQSAVFGRPGGAMVVLFVLAVFVLSIMLDRVRIFSWNKLSNKLFYAE